MTTFSKYEGCGNDFILFDNRKKELLLSPQNIKKLCHRQQGIGADGVILLEESFIAQFKMRIFNADGSEAEMCGNGLRCLVRFIHSLGIVKDRYQIEVMQQVLTATCQGPAICIEMNPPTSIRWSLPVSFENQTYSVHALNTGVPHAVIFASHIDRINLKELGSHIRHHSLFAPQGTNVNVAELLSNNEIRLRTFERGVENETLACGTGATATALAAAYHNKLSGPLFIQTLSKETLQVDFHLDKESFSKVTLSGPANLIFEGQVKIN